MRRRRNPDSSEFWTVAALAGAAWWWYHRTPAAVIAPQQAAQIATAALAAAAAPPASRYVNQFTDSDGANIHCRNGQTIQGRDSIAGCYDVGANGPLGSSWSKEFREANPILAKQLPDSYPVF